MEHALALPRIASVILDEGIDRLLDYSIPEHLAKHATIGARVLVPLRGKSKKGTLVAIIHHSPYKTVPIEAIFEDDANFPQDLFALSRWMADYYVCPLRRALTLALPSCVRSFKKEREQLLIKPLLSKERLVALCEEKRVRRPAQAAVLDVVLKAPQGIFLSELLEKANTTRGPIDALIKEQILAAKPLVKADTPLFEYFHSKPKPLNEEQLCALKTIQTALCQNTFSPHLLFGVTGSGKTEVYLQAIATALEQGKSALVLVPEISLTEQTIQRLKSRFEEKIAVLHHKLSDGARASAWKKMRTGEIRLALGARSALFAPLQNLKLIIVDEEHESSYKQTEQAPAYLARDVAVLRAKLLDATIVLGSATPSLESFRNAQEGKYRLLTLSKRPHNIAMPTVRIVDMRKEREKNQGFTLFSDALLRAMKERIELGEQTLLFLNRRGYHSSQMCLACGHTLKCPHCDLTLTFHKKSDVLTCHLCAFTLSPPPRECPECKACASLKFKGVGTEQVERALHALLPEVRTLRMDADTTRHVGAHDKLIQEFRSGKADVLIGTQMIAKGLDFPEVTLVGVIHADSALHIPDFRAQEFAFQTFAQVAGRSGRGARKGEVVIQTTAVDHKTILLAAAQDYLSFAKEEIEVRKAFAYPPFERLIKLTFSGKEEQIVLQEGEKVRDFLLSSLPSTFTLTPLTSCGHAKIKDSFRFQFLIKGKNLHRAQTLLHTLAVPKKVRLMIDVDPLSTYF